jgi:hypothetical protein
MSNIVNTTNTPAVEATTAPVETQDNTVQQSVAETSNAVESTEVTTEDTSQDQHAVDHDDSDVDAIEDEDDDGSDAEARKVPRGVEKRFAKMRQKQAWQEEELLRARNELAALKAQVQAKQVQAPVAPVKEEAPKLEDFESYSEWTDAKIRYEARELVKAELAQRDAMVKSQQVVDSYQTRLQDAAKRIPDLMDRLTNLPLDLPAPADDVVQYMRTSEVGPEIAYHFATHEADLRKFVALPPLMQAIEVAKIEERLMSKAAVKTAPKAKTATTANKPPATLDGGSTPKIETAADLANDYNAWKKKMEEERGNSRSRRR